MCACFFNNNFHIAGVVFATGMFCDHVWVKKWTMMLETEGKTDCNITIRKEFRFWTGL